MAKTIINIRSALVQASYNERMARILSYELAYTSIFGSVAMAWLWGWQWFFWGIILIPVILAVGLSIPLVADLILIILGMFWALPFIFLGFLISSAFFLLAIIVFAVSIWVHSKGLTWYQDLSRWD